MTERSTQLSARGREDPPTPRPPAGGDAKTAAYPASYYAATANPAPERPPLQGGHDTEIAVLGAGYTGLSCALALAERGHKVTVLEAHKVGWGASGRNGGQIVNGLNAGLAKIGDLHGRDIQDFVGRLLTEGAGIIRDRVARYAIDCDLKPGNLFAATNPAQLKDLEAEKKLWARYDAGEFEWVDRAGIRAHVGTDVYAGGLIDWSGGHLHPLNLALGEAAALESLGGTVHETSRVTEIHPGPRPALITETGRLTCRTLVLAGNAYLGKTAPRLAPRILPAATQIVATEPLGAKAREILPTDLCVEDLRYILDYFRLSADGRLLFGGGTIYGGRSPRDIAAKLRPNLARVFPALADTPFTHAWSGNIALTLNRIPQLGRLDDDTYFAHGYSGHGVTGSHLFGRILAEAIDGDLTRFDTFADLPSRSFPGGQSWAVPYSVLGSWWYGLRDRLGI
ncbi:MAG: FAD-binding oxidoreductase [Pseudomonadota bacterium]